MAPLVLLILGAAAVGIGLAAAGKTETKPGTTPSPAPTPKAPTGSPSTSTSTPIDVGQVLDQAISAAGSGSLTPDQLAKLKSVLSNLGTDDQGKLKTRPPIWARDEALALADTLDKNAVPLVGPALRMMVLAADQLPEGGNTSALPSYEKPTVSGFEHLGSFSGPECGGFSDWWDGFVQKWSANWWRR
jgi:hypothetical protein